MATTTAVASRDGAEVAPPPLRHDLVQALMLNALALAMSALVIYLYYRQPVAYVWLIAEDHVGENAQALGFAVAGLLLLALAWRPGPALRRASWALIGLVTLLIAGEEISWGERILEGVFALSYPESVRAINRQGEFNIHNAVDSLVMGRTTKLAALAMIAWLALSAAVIAWWPRLAERLDRMGVPLIAAQFYGFFLVAIGFRLSGATRNDEIFELFLALGAAAWALHLYLRHRRPAAAAGRRGLMRVGGLLAALLLTGSAIAPLGSHDMLTSTYNITAERDYPLRGLHDQSDRLYAHIYRDPRHELPRTRFRHARLLMERGREDEAAALLADVLMVGAGRAGTEADASVAELRYLAIAHQTLGQASEAEQAFERAVALAEERLAGLGDPEERAELLWELAKTLEARGDLEGALAAAENGAASARTAALKDVITKWVQFTIVAPGRD